MDNQNPFTEKENDILNHLVEAHNLFIELEETHPTESMEWATAIHGAQNVLSNRILRRIFPKIYPTYQPNKYDK